MQCSKCQGDGRIEEAYSTDGGMVGTEVFNTCDFCNGSGSVPKGLAFSILPLGYYVKCASCGRKTAWETSSPSSCKHCGSYFSY